MNYSLIIDYREHTIKKYFEGLDFSKDKNLKNIDLKIENLDLGDIVIKKDDKIILIIERKTFQDLYSSINDGRYKEQKIRLKHNYNDYQIVYIIEDCDVKYIKNKFSNFDSIVNGAIINSIFRDNIKLLRTKNIDETLIYIKTLLKKVQNNLDFFVKPNIIDLQNKNLLTNTGLVPNDDLLTNSDLLTNKDYKDLKIIEIKTNNDDHYVDNIKIKKKDNNTPNNCNIIMLCQIPGVSTKISKIIINKYMNISKLILEYNKLKTTNDKEILLKDLSYPITNDKTRKIGPVISKRIYEYFFSI